MILETRKGRSWRGKPMKSERSLGILLICYESVYRKTERMIQVNENVVPACVH